VGTEKVAPNAHVIPELPADGIELMIIITSTFAQALAGSGPTVNIIAVLTLLRFLMGVGIGGDYPLSAIITSEFASTRSRGRLMTAVFTSQGWGYLGMKPSLHCHRLCLRLSASTVVALVTISIFEKAILRDPSTDLYHLDYCWRLLVGVGCIPGIIALYFRLTIPETPRFTMDIERNVKKACRNIEAVLSANGVTPGVWRMDPEASTERTDAPAASLRDFMNYFGQWKNARVLLGTAYSWFALDVRMTCTIEKRNLMCLVPDRVLWPRTQLIQSLHGNYARRFGIGYRRGPWGTWCICPHP
jgi:MFS transporter, PHS family, inorganic phosphate transporter